MKKRYIQPKVKKIKLKAEEITLAGCKSETQAGPGISRACYLQRCDLAAPGLEQWCSQRGS